MVRRGTVQLPVLIVLPKAMISFRKDKPNAVSAIVIGPCRGPIVWSAGILELYQATVMRC